MTNKIYVGNISELTTDSDLFSLFSKSGQVMTAKISVGIDMKNTGHGYVTMNNDKDMEKAILKCNNSLLKGNRIRVIEAHFIDKDRDYLSKQNRFRTYRRF